MKALIHQDEIKRLLAFVKPRSVQYFTGLFGSSIVNAIASMIIAFILKDLVDAAVAKSSILLYRSIWMTLLMILLECLAAPGLEYLYNSSIRKTTADVRIRLFSHIAGMRISSFERLHSGDIVSRMNGDVQMMEQAYSDQLRMVIINILYGAGSAVLMFFIDWRIASILIAFNGLSLLLNSRFAGPIRRISDQIQDKTGFLVSRMSDILAGFTVMKLFGIKKLLFNRFAAENEGLTRRMMQRTRKSALLDATNYLLVWVNFGGVMIAGSWMVMNGSISYGRLIAVVQLLNGVTFMFLQLGSFLSQLQGSLAGANRVYELLDAEPEPERYQTRPVDAAGGAVVLENVVFGYEEENRVLEGISLKADTNRVTALVGPSGGGKSTVIKMLLGYYPPDSGGIALLGKNMMQYSLEEIRDLLAYVPQDTYLFDGTIRENIRYGRLDASEDEIIAAAKMAFAHEFILEQPDGYDTTVGERGARLSGGQKQRIAIARAFLKNAPILLLDEATSALDSESELLVQTALNELMKGRTVVVIAHRLTTIEHADHIYVVEDGKVVEEGNHESLLQDNGAYRRLYELQYKKSA